jgi:hypothetical protein
VTTTLATTTSKSGGSTTSATSTSASATGKVKYGKSSAFRPFQLLLTNLVAGVNIAGFDFGCLTDGSDNITDVYPPLSALGGPDGEVSYSRIKEFTFSGLFHGFGLMNVSGEEFLNGMSNY